MVNSCMFYFHLDTFKKYYLKNEYTKGTLGTLEFDGAKSSSQITHSSFMTKISTIIDCSDAVPISKTKIGETALVSKSSSIKLSGHGGSDEW